VLSVMLRQVEKHHWRGHLRRRSNRFPLTHSTEAAPHYSAERPCLSALLNGCGLRRRHWLTGVGADLEWHALLIAPDGPRQAALTLRRHTRSGEKAKEEV